MSSSDQSFAGIAYHSPQEILAHPSFAIARAAFVDAVLALYEGDAFLTRLLLEAARTVIFTVIMCLHARYDESEPATWPTMSVLKRHMTQFGLASPRRIEELVARLIHTGFLEPIPSKKDGRMRLLVPTARMFAADQDWLAAHYLPLQVMFPNPGYAPSLHRDVDFQLAQRVVAMGFLGHGAEIMAGNPAMMLFLGRDAGVMVLIKLVQMAGAANGPSEFSHEDIGARFGVSRTHIRLILKDAEQAGLVAISSRGGRFVELKPALWQAFDRFVAESMSGHDLLFEIARRQMTASARASA
jgi:hypothetical protein